jgi:uncharacterized protein YcbK (DUF882 family)
VPLKRHPKLATPLSRRGFLKGCAATAAGLSIHNSFAALPPEHERHLALHNLHTGEKSKLTYWAEGDYLSESLAEINHILRDFRTGEVYPIDPVLLDMLHMLKLRAGRKGPFEIISGYRSPKTNDALRANSSGVAKRSLHMQGRALDIRLPGVDLHKLHQSAVNLKVGGVGLYSQSDFIHIDTGRVRYWGS